MTTYYYVEYYDHASLDDNNGEGVNLHNATPVIAKFVGLKVKEGDEGGCKYTVFSLEQSNIGLSGVGEGAPTYCMIIINSCIKVMREIEI